MYMYTCIQFVWYDSTHVHVTTGRKGTGLCYYRATDNQWIGLLSLHDATHVQYMLDVQYMVVL